MAVYSDDMPKGVDVIFNTNKKSGTPMTDVLKKIKDDPDNPFGSLRGNTVDKVTMMTPKRKKTLTQLQVRNNLYR